MNKQVVYQFLKMLNTILNHTKSNIALVAKQGSDAVRFVIVVNMVGTVTTKRRSSAHSAHAALGFKHCVKFIRCNAIFSEICYASLPFSFGRSWLSVFQIRLEMFYKAFLAFSTILVFASVSCIKLCQWQDFLATATWFRVTSVFTAAWLMRFFNVLQAKQRIHTVFAARLIPALAIASFDKLFQWKELLAEATPLCAIGQIVGIFTGLHALAPKSFDASGSLAFSTLGIVSSFPRFIFTALKKVHGGQFSLALDTNFSCFHSDIIRIIANNANIPSIYMRGLA